MRSLLTAAVGGGCVARALTRLRSGAHVQWRDRQPHGIDPDHRSSSRVQAAKAVAAEVGHEIFIVTAPWRNSTSMPRSATDRSGAAVNATGTKSCEGAGLAAPAVEVHRCC